MSQRRNAKIIATLGPASQTPSQIEALHRKGANVFRLNFSHGSHDILKDLIAIIRDLERKCGRPIGILMDLQGPKLRVGTFIDGKITLKTGDHFRLDRSKKPGDQTRVSLPHPEVFSALKPKHDLLLDDGRIRLRVEKKTRDYIDTRVITGGVLSDHKGLNVPNTVLALPALTTKDKRDLRFALKNGADWIGLSFVQRPKDVAEIQAIAKGRASIMSKLEKPAAIQELDKIIALSDAVMVARGDLGVEMPPEEVPTLQKRIIRHCHEAGKPVVVATQMLESMIQSPAPTRAEASDVATAIYDGADAVMLSAETAVGSYGKEAVGMMERIIRQVEQDDHYLDVIETTRVEATATASDAITAAAGAVAHTISAAAIVTYTTSGSTALRAARQRPSVPIMCLTNQRSTARRMTVVWGLYPVVTGDVRNFTEMVARAARIAVRERFARKGQQLVVTAGVPFGTPGATNVLRIFTVNE
ncbi:MAG: pyruvate kinase [Rhodospirillales bacterium]|jgi:pyruvate kinase|nr:pyruvate kinase [Rhodospirillales bacterium]MBT4006478.1 pyruvate kinase [Rhodospirillales bacterium]MBT5076507.1 pyruvate kinase [Rhodospirillales bacterium]MBT5113756.1 pyruvate kinase [Rhodospirillales bacterium]MBT5672284.1 pyruvate kinase [Rhodospirillales bacterium]